MDWLTTMSGLSRLQWFPSNSVSDPTITYILCLAAFLPILYIIITLLSYRYHLRGRWNPFSQKLLRIWLSLLYGPFYIPLLNRSVSYMTCVNTSLNGCSSMQVGWWEVGLLSMMLVPVLMFGLLYVSSIYSWWIQANDTLAKSSSRAATLIFVTRTTVVVIYGFYEHIDSFLSSFLLSILSVVHNALAFFILLKDLPYMQHSTNVICCCSHGVALWFGCAAIQTFCLNNNQDNGPVWTCLLGMIPTLLSVLYLVKSRTVYLEQAPLSQILTDTDFDIKIRIFQQHYLKHTHWNTEVSEMEKGVETKDFIEELDLLFQGASVIFPYSATLNLSWSSYAMSIKKNGFLAMTLLQKVRRCSPNMFQSFAAEMRLWYITDPLITGEREDDIIDYLKQQRLESDLSAQMIQCITSQMMFWKIVIHNPGALIYCMKELAKTYDDALKSSTEHIHQLLKMNPTSPYYRRLYGHFLLNIAGDEELSSLQFGKALELDAEGALNRNDEIANINNGMVIISGEEENLGHILLVNNKAASLLLYSPAELIGKNVTVLMPFGYGGMHNQHMMNHINTKKSVIIKNRRIMIFKNKKGYAFEGELMVREFCHFNNKPGIAYVGIIYTVEKERPFCLVEMKSLLLTDMSLSFHQIFNVKMAQVVSGNLPLASLIPRFNEMVDVALNSLQQNQSYTLLVTNYQGAQKGSPILLTLKFAPNSQQTYLYVVVEVGKTVRTFTHVDHQFYEHLSEEVHVTSKKRNKELSTVGKPGFRLESKVLGKSNAQISSRGSALFEKFSTRKTPSFQYFMGTSLSQSSNFQAASGSITNSEKENKHNSLSRVSMGSVSMLVVRKSTETGRKHMDPYFIKRYWSLSAMMMTLLCISAATLIVSKLTLFNNLQQQIDLLQSLVNLPWAIQSAENNVHIILAIEKDKTLPVDPHSQKIQSNLDMAVLMMDDFRQAMSTYGRNIDMNTLNILLQPNITIWKNGLSQNFNFMDSIYIYSTQMTLLRNGNWSDMILQNNSDMAFFETNNGNGMSNVFEHVIPSLQDYQGQLNVQMESFAISVLVVSLSITLSMTVFLLLPMVERLEQLNISISRIFAGIPPEKLRQGLKDASDKFRRLLSHDESYTDAAERANRSSMKKMMEQNKLGQQFIGEAKRTLNYSRVQLLSNKKTYQLGITAALSLGYFLFFYLQFGTMRQLFLEDFNARSNVNCNRPKLVSLIFDHYIQSYNTTSQRYVVDNQSVKELEDNLWDLEFAFVFGDPSYGINHDLSILPASEKFLFTDLCPELNILQCQKYRNGLVTHGIHELVNNFVSFSEYLRQTSNSSQENVYVELKDILLLKEMIDNYVQPGLFLSTQSFIEDLNETFTSFLFRMIILTVFFIVLSLLLLICYYRPLLKSMDEELKRTRAVLLMIPCSILENCVNLKKEIKAMEKGLFYSAHTQLS